MSRCIIHVGMHKTGTSSIQQSLNGFKDQRFIYANINGHPNHSRSLLNLFVANPDEHVAFRNVRERQAIAGRIDLLEALRFSIKEAGCRTYILSGEGIALLSLEELIALRNYLLASFTEVTIVAAVRPPAGYLASAFQEPVKQGTSFPHKALARYRSYNATFRKFDDVFGRENVHLWKFDPKSFPGGCAVQDFCERLGIDFPFERIVRVNESLSREALGLLFTYRKLGQHLGATSMTGAQNRKLVQQMAAIGNTKFRFSPDIIRPLLEKNRADIQWMEERIGQSLYEELGAYRPGDVRDEADLLQPDPEVVRKLLALLGDAAPAGIKGETPEEVALLVHTMRQKRRQEMRPKPDELPVKHRDTQRKVVNVIELIELVQETTPKLLDGIPANEAEALLTNVFKCMNDTLAGIQGGVVNYMDLGQFHVRRVEKEVAGKKTADTQTVFILCEPSRARGRSKQAGTAKKSLLNGLVVKKIHFFVHIPKTAGTSFRKALERNELAHVLHDYGERDPSSDPELMAIDYRELTPEHGIFRPEKYNFICGHVSYRKYAHCVSSGSVVSIVRNPIERLVSEFQHSKRHDGFTGGFTDFYTNPAYDSFAQDKQSKMLKGLELSHGPMIGLTSHYKYFVELFSSKLGIPMELVAVNAAPVSDLEERLNISSAEIKSAYRWNKKDVDFFFDKGRMFARLIQDFGYNTVPPVGAKWNCRIDESRRVVGWISCGYKDCYFIVISVNGDRRVVISLDQNRSDIYEKGLSENPTCGFAYPISLLGVEKGDDLSVEVLDAPGFKKTLTAP